MWNAILSPDFFGAILRAATPILFATLAAAIASKSGITNMALEGIMLFSALFGVIFSSLTHSAWLGLLITVAIGGFIGLILAFFVPPVPAVQVDTIGAGDSHIGSVIACLKKGNPLKTAIQKANRVSSSVVASSGALLSDTAFDKLGLL